MAEKTDEGATKERRPHRRTDLWPVIKANIAPIAIVLSLFGSIVGIGYATFQVTEFMTPEMREALKFVVETVNPEKMKDWAKRQTKSEAAVKATTDLSNRRWCMNKKLVAKVPEGELMECLNESVK